MMNLEIRKASASDWQAISDVVTAAFEGEGPEITKLIDGLLQDSSAYPLLSLVATIHDHVVGHILFTNTQIKHAQQTVSSAILAPLAVSPGITIALRSCWDSQRSQNRFREEISSAC